VGGLLLAARHYELMVILAPDLEERTIAPSLEQFLSVIRNSGGTVEKVDVWGRRRLAYEIEKNFEGIYAVVELFAEPDATVELDRQLNLNESVLRTKVLRRPEPKPVAISAPAAVAAVAAASPVTAS
jgi:small subunit ribosomal protein S6